MFMNRKKSLIKGSLFLALFWGCAHQQHEPEHQHQHHHRFDDAEKWSKVFDEPGRETWQKPKELTAALGMKPKQVVAEIGAGTGYFVPYLLQTVPHGEVLAIDIEPSLIDHLNRRILRERWVGASAHLTKLDHPQLPKRADLILLVNTYHHIEKRVEYFKELRTQLKPKGRVALVDFTMESPKGPKASMKVALEQVKQEMKAAGFTAAKAFDFLPDQYFVIFE
jgi:cyclopropane fatty-acyl-phospholipid synthase-like methyltransferase